MSTNIQSDALNPNKLKLQLLHIAESTPPNSPKSATLQSPLLVSQPQSASSSHRHKNNIINPQLSSSPRIASPQRTFRDIKPGSTNLNSFETNFKNNFVSYLKNENKSSEEMEFLKKHLGSCKFFQHYAIPMGEDVFQTSIRSLQVATFERDDVIISKGDTVDRLYIVICGSVICSVPNKKSNLSNQANNNTNAIIPSANGLVQPVNSILESTFMENGQAESSVKVVEETILCYLPSDIFKNIVASSENRELIEGLNGLRMCSFFKDWSLVLLKGIIQNSTLVNYQLHQSVYNQDDKSVFWYVVLNGECEYIREVPMVLNEDEQLAVKDKISNNHEEGSQGNNNPHTLLLKSRGQSQDGKATNVKIKVSIATKGEIVGIEDLLPLHSRYYSLKCISSKATLRQINGTYLQSLKAHNTEELAKFSELANWKRKWLKDSTENKMPMSQQYHSTILESKRNLAAQLMKKREEFKEQQLLKTALMNQQQQSQNQQDTTKPLMPLLPPQQKGISLGFMPEKAVTFIKPEPKEDENLILKRELIKEYKSMKEAKNQLLSSYRGTIQQFFIDSNQKLYKRAIKKEGIVSVEQFQQQQQNPSPQQDSIQRSSSKKYDISPTPSKLTSQRASRADLSSQSSSTTIQPFHRFSRSENLFGQLADTPKKQDSPMISGEITNNVSLPSQLNILRGNQTLVVGINSGNSTNNNSTSAITGNFNNSNSNTSPLKNSQFPLLDSIQSNSSHCSPFYQTYRHPTTSTPSPAHRQVSRLNLRLFQQSPNIERVDESNRFLLEKIESGFDIPQNVKRIFFSSRQHSPVIDPPKPLANTSSNQRLESLIASKSFLISQSLYFAQNPKDKLLKLKQQQQIQYQPIYSHRKTQSQNQQSSPFVSAMSSRKSHVGTAHNWTFYPKQQLQQQSIIGDRQVDSPPRKITVRARNPVVNSKSSQSSFHNL